MYSAPVLLEINSRIWIREISERLGKRITLSEVPESEIDRWRSLGLTHIWLMGVWESGPEARKLALDYWERDWWKEIPSTMEDVQGSPFAIAAYAVDPHLGTPLELLLFKERLTHAGLKLILDFVPNHLGIDSGEPREHPARFVQAHSPRPGTFPMETKYGLRHFAHGRDPYFPPWSDTVQVDFRVAEAQDAMSAIGQTVSMFCHGLRCDMAMLLLPEIFQEVWKDYPIAGRDRANGNFWRAAIPRIRQLQPFVDLIAEAYWDREAELQDCGFDFTYNKRVTDYLVRGEDEELARFLYGCSSNYLERSVHFLENHDEARAAAVLPFRRHKAAAALMFFLPGMVLLHEGQLEGRKQFTPVQMTRRPPEKADPELQRFYTTLLETLPKTAIRNGKAELVRTHDAQTIVVRWEELSGGIDVGVVNLRSSETRLTSAQLHRSDVPPLPWECLYSTAEPPSFEGGIVSLPPVSAHIFRLRSSRVSG